VPATKDGWAKQDQHISKFRGDREIVIRDPKPPGPINTVVFNAHKNISTGFLQTGPKQRVDLRVTLQKKTFAIGEDINVTVYTDN
jgi:hypothetical protein